MGKGGTTIDDLDFWIGLVGDSAELWLLEFCLYADFA